MNAQPPHERALELQADKAVFGLSAEEVAELNALLGDEAADEGLELELAAAALAASMSSADREPMPASLRQKVKARLDSEIKSAPTLRISEPMVRETAKPVAPPAPVVTTQRKWGPLAYTGWAAAASLAIVAGALWFGRSKPTPVGPIASERESPEVRRRRLVEAGAQPLTWLAWAEQTGQEGGPEVPGVTGDVVWSENREEGYMRFVGLTPNDPSKEQYQLWIVDSELGMQQRISGGVFNVSETGEVVVPIRPALDFGKPVAFAVTIERPGGVWVSDMSRRVVIALAP